jgi:hypothetical protein
MLKDGISPKEIELFFNPPAPGSAPPATPGTTGRGSALGGGPGGVGGGMHSHTKMCMQ